jgi:hypothetical protein
LKNLAIEGMKHRIKNGSVFVYFTKTIHHDEKYQINLEFLQDTHMGESYFFLLINLYFMVSGIFFSKAFSRLYYRRILV